MIKYILLTLFLPTFVFAKSPISDPIPRDCEQLIVGLTDNWNSSRGKIYLFEKQSRNRNWSAVTKRPYSLLLGRNGLAWGRGLFGQKMRGKHKKEGDGRSPAGVFTIGKIYGMPNSLPKGANYPYRKVTRWDAWVDNPKLALYNQHYVANPRKKIPSWFESQRMKLTDKTYTYLITIDHNTHNPIAGRGSAIFFHLQRGPNKKTSGCSALLLRDIRFVVTWLRDNKNPTYVLLPIREYRYFSKKWNLPRL